MRNHIAVRAKMTANNNIRYSNFRNVYIGRDFTFLLYDTKRAIPDRNNIFHCTIILT